VSPLRRPFLFDRYFFVTVRLLKERPQLVDTGFHWLARPRLIKIVELVLTDFFSPAKWSADRPGRRWRASDREETPRQSGKMNEEFAPGGRRQRPQDWQWSSVREYSGMSATEQGRWCGLTIGRVKMPSDPRTRT
jgi:hypothetical protein